MERHLLTTVAQENLPLSASAAKPNPEIENQRIKTIKAQEGHLVEASFHLLTYHSLTYHSKSK